MDEVRALKVLWRDVFGDGDAVIDAYFSRYYRPELAVSERIGAELAGACHLMPLGALVLPDGRSEACAAIYALATAPVYRGRGCAGRVTAGALLRARELGFPAVVLHPASEGLFDFYRRNGFVTAFYARESVVSGSRAGTSALPVSPERYREIREERLRGRLHVDLDARALGFQAELCRLSGGGLFETENGGCMILERGDGGAHIKELLADALPELDGGRYTVRAPAPDGGGRAFGMLACGGVMPAGAEGWMGPVFD